MRILQLGKFYPIKGGIEKVMYDLTLGLSNKKIECDMLCTIEKKYQEIKLNDYGKIICCPYFLKFAATTFSLHLIYKLRRICNSYDLIHIHHPDPMACLALYLSGFKGKIIVHWHADIVKQKRLMRLYKPFQTWLLNRASLIIGTTPFYIKSSPFLKEFQHKSIYLPIGVDKLKPNEEEVQVLRKQFKNKKIIFSLGRLVDYKGFKYLIDAARYLNDDFIVLIAGDGPNRKEYEEQINTFKLADRVKLLGYISEKEKENLFGACDIFCLPSIHKAEAFGIVQIEAMSIGKPIVTTKIDGSGVHWVNFHEVSGINVTVKNSIELSLAIKEILKDKEIYKNYSLNAKSRFKYLFTKKEMINKCISIYNETLHLSNEESISNIIVDQVL